MSSKIEKKEKNQVTLKIEVDAQTFEKGVQSAYNKNKGKFNIHGFRKGKAPRKIIELNYGEGVFYEEAINIIFPEVYEAAIKEHGLDPVARPDLDVEAIEKGKPVVFVVDVTVKPEVNLGDYKGIEVEKVEYNVTDEDVNEELKTIQNRNARIIEAEDRPVKEGDILTIDYSGFVGEEQFEGGTAENQTLEIGSGAFIPGFEEQLVGKNKDEEVEVKVTFPEEYHAENLAGKEAIFKVTIHEIKVKELPELDDELAKDVSEFDTLEELKKDIKVRLEEQAKNKEKVEIENKIIEKACELSEVEIPEAMIERQIDVNVNEFGYRLSYQGLDLSKYLELTGMEFSDFRAQFKEDAEKFVKGDLVIEAIGKKEGIEASEEELNNEIEKLSKQYGQDVDKFTKNLDENDLDYIKMGIIKRKAIDFLVDSAKLV
ncbi:trigger factor Tig [Gottschalkia purinilytica]|uniref:Trigger factor n=1 Tax=Gottschalkia purinilytica TaxID=1503 RepID=A0A0L0W8T1_GOTPU|nr:trigger factor [Gottschalkia purinilytica]KNF07862.1 trigger factor Tig [Gottschalkia purinilytica]